MRKLSVIAAIAASLALVGLLVPDALGTPPQGSATSTLLNKGTTADRIKEINRNGVQFKAQGPVDIYNTTLSASPGWSSGWHHHEGPIFASVKSGTLTFYNSDCVATIVGPGQAAIEPTGEPILARNEGTETVVEVVTQIVPAGSPTRVDEPGFCGLS